MKKILKTGMIIFLLICVVICMTGCEYEYSGSKEDMFNQIEKADDLASSQPTPTDIKYSLERYNLIRRAYWVNGQREKANAFPCEIEKPLGYIVLFTGNTVVGKFIVDGKVSSLNSFLTPDTKYPSFDSTYNVWLADVDGSYGENDSGIFFFTTDGKYIEWNGDYLYSDIPFTVSNPIVTYQSGAN